jgi:hypothetical protein
MPALTSRTHAVLDYVVGAALLVAPWALGFAGREPASTVPMTLGAVLLAYSLVTDYELGVVRRLQIPVHLWLDAIVGVLLGISPWLFGFDREVWAPHVAIGAVLVVLAVFSDTIPGYERRRAAR